MPRKIAKLIPRLPCKKGHIVDRATQARINKAIQLVLLYHGSKTTLPRELRFILEPHLDNVPLGLEQTAHRAHVLRGRGGRGRVLALAVGAMRPRLGKGLAAMGAHF